MRNAALLFAYNNCDLTRAAIESVLAQTIPVDLTVINNGSTDGTTEMLDGIYVTRPGSFFFYNYAQNESPTVLCNKHLAELFAKKKHVLCLANDIVLPPDFYEELLKWPRGIVCGAEVRELPLPDMKPYKAISENTPMSAMLLRRWVYDAVIARDGFFFDERFFHYASDCDLALRVASCGIWGIQINVPYLHHSSATINHASPKVQAEMHARANQDRAAFHKKWGFGVADLEYGQKAVDINFRGTGDEKPTEPANR